MSQPTLVKNITKLLDDTVVLLLTLKAKPGLTDLEKDHISELVRMIQSRRTDFLRENSKSAIFKLIARIIDLRAKFFS